MKIYTKTGDKGQTSLIGGKRVPKYHIRVDAYGTTDELNSFVGLLRDQKIDSHTKAVLLKIQNDIFVIGGLLATANTAKSKNKLAINENNSLFLEGEIDTLNKDLPTLTNFILPGGHPTVSYCHIARNICRRAERLVVKLAEDSPIDSSILIYLNRLSDYLFVLARKLSKDLHIDEIIWTPE